MKILVLNGSPKKKSDTFRLTEAFLRGMNKAGNHEVDVINVIEKNIAPCMGCFGCWEQGKGHCVIEDQGNVYSECKWRLRWLNKTFLTTRFSLRVTKI